MTAFVAGGLEGAGVLAPKPRVTITGQDGTVLEFEAAVREVHSGSSQITDHPVEDGSVVSDHVINQPDKIEIQGIISNRPILLLASIRAQPSVPGGDPRTRAEDAFAAIQRLRKAAVIVTVGTRLRDYENMLIEDESTTRDKNTSEILDVLVRLREFRFATVEAADQPEPEEANDGNKTDQGRKQTTDASPAVQTKTDSLLVELADFTSAFVGG